MLTITPIGSCRIATPLRLCRESHGFEMNMARIWGYTHSSSEAVQQMRYLHGEFEPSEEVWPFIAPKWKETERLWRKHEKSDLYIVEISSLKQLQLDGASIQLNYVRQAFEKFFADKERSKAFNTLLVRGDEADRTDFLAKHWSATPEQREEAETLARMSMVRTDEETLRADMEELRRGLGEVLFVTHVNARTSDGEVIPSRQKFIEMVKAAGRQTGAKVYDPTPLMREVGQTEAIEDHSTALAHYTDRFSALVLEDWYEQHIHDLVADMVIDDPQSVIERVIVPHAKAFLDSGDRERRDDIRVLLESIESYCPLSPEAKKIQLEMALIDGTEAEIKRIFFQIAMNDDLGSLGELGDLVSTLPMMPEWAKELCSAPQLNSNSARWLARVATQHGDATLAKELEGHR